MTPDEAAAETGRLDPWTAARDAASTLLTGDPGGVSVGEVRNWLEAAGIPKCREAFRVALDLAQAARQLLEQALLEQRPAVTAYGDAIELIDKALTIPNDEPGAEAGLLEGIGLLVEQRDQARATVQRLTAELERRDAGEHPLPGMPELATRPAASEWTAAREAATGLLTGDAEDLAVHNVRAWLETAGYPVTPETIHGAMDIAWTGRTLLDTAPRLEVERLRRELDACNTERQRLAEELAQYDLQAFADLRAEVAKLRDATTQRNFQHAAVRQIHRITEDVLAHAWIGGEHPEHRKDCMVCGAEEFRARLEAAAKQRLAKDLEEGK